MACQAGRDYRDLQERGDIQESLERSAYQDLLALLENQETMVTLAPQEPRGLQGRMH